MFWWLTAAYRWCTRRIASKYTTEPRATYINMITQVFKHTFNFFHRYKHEPQEVKLQVSFGKGPDSFWTNCFPSKLVNQFAGDIKKFGKVLKIIKWTMPILGIVPIRIMLRIFFFSKDFGDKMVFPLIALFLGTGNQTANVSCAILERLFVGCPRISSRCILSKFYNSEITPNGP